ncbi:type II toxin-antitoxin system RelE/ParE family toxin [Pseudanabaena sp. UWO311]|jgi:mRNA interferase RelE/StbE|uniref:type II toxin-antitoxin system RelE family toxin n=1 Tax=Pseudanabaena sp. UWO311 TaxID=2487337 RepID=UPI00115945C4|nr:type II toxin-antitoxin system RelE/ParE family toxin [Pseudanabaena sp. UWO311]TYQ25980.1 type II toxin-antitoxin system RelE/ParE family toxin [Pseudanabaena sp. UWO311]
MSYEVQILPKAARQIKALSLEIRQDITLTIQSLANEPRPIGVKKLSGEKDIYRVRVGNYRVLYQIIDKVLVVVVVSVGHRREVYRDR